MIYRSSDHPGLRYSGIYSFMQFVYTVKLVYSDHWREFWKRSYKTGSLYIEVIIFAPKIPRGNHLVRVYCPHQLLNPFVWRTNAWKGYNEIKRNVLKLSLNISVFCGWNLERNKRIIILNQVYPWLNDPLFFTFFQQLLFS